MATTDDVARLTAILVHDHVIGGKAARLRDRAAGSPDTASLMAGQLAKAAGVPIQTLLAFEQGTAVPTTQQALAWLSELYRRQPWGMADTRPVGDLEGARPPGLLIEAGPPLPGPAKVLAGAGGRPATFTPDLDRLDRRDLADCTREIAERAGLNPLMPGRVTSPVVAFLAELAAQAPGDAGVKIAHALTREHRIAVHEVFQSARRRLHSDESPLEPVAARLLAEWDSHIKWKPGDPRQRRTAGPEEEPASDVLRMR